MKHTPGPWGYWPECCREGGMITANKSGGHIAAPTFYNQNPEKTKANAQLISCAPEMLEILKRVDKAVTNCETINWEDVTRVIGKAEGK